MKRGRWALKLFFSNGKAVENDYSSLRILKFVETMLLSNPSDYRNGENGVCACEIVWKENDDV